MDTNKIKKGLGRGLSSLIGETKTEININKLSISELVSNKFQPRKFFDEDNLQDLTNSIKERGIIQPIIVRKSSDNNSKYEIIAGERRWLAAQKAGLHEVPVVIADVDDLKSLEFAIIENVQRNDLNAIEEARGYQRLIEEFSYDQEKVAEFIGKSRSHIANSLRLLALPETVLKLIEIKKLGNKWVLKIIGPYKIDQGGAGKDYLNKLKKMSSNYPIKFFEPIFNTSLLNKEYAKASIFLYPSIAEKGETFGLAPLEAMAFGTVPIVSNLECFKDFIKQNKNGLIFNHSYKPEVALANKIKILQDSKVLLKKLSVEAFKVNKSHSVEKIANLFLDDFKKIISNNNKNL